MPGPGGCLVWGVPAPRRGTWSGTVPGLGGLPGLGVPGLGGAWSGCRGSPPPDGYCCGRYASSWNAFLLFNVSGTVISTFHKAHGIINHF